MGRSRADPGKIHEIWGCHGLGGDLGVVKELVKECLGVLGVTGGSRGSKGKEENITLILQLDTLKARVANAHLAQSLVTIPEVEHHGVSQPFYNWACTVS